jgi:hypothetical protein
VSLPITINLEDLKRNLKMKGSSRLNEESFARGWNSALDNVMEMIREGKNITVPLTNSNYVFYMSFVKDHIWAGGVYVEGDTFEQALTNSHIVGCNPGGEVAATGPIPKGLVRVDYLNRLLDRKEIEDAHIESHNPHS